MRLKDALHSRDAGEVGDVMKMLESVSWDAQTGGQLKVISRYILLFKYTEAAGLVDQLMARATNRQVNTNP